MATRLRLMKHDVTEPETHRILELAKAGMSYALIAAEVYGTKANGEPTDISVRRIGYILSREGVGVTDYRNGHNSLGRAVIAAIRREANILQSIRSAAREVAVKVRESA